MELVLFYPQTLHFLCNSYELIFLFIIIIIIIIIIINIIIISLDSSGMEHHWQSLWNMFSVIPKFVNILTWVVYQPSGHCFVKLSFAQFKQTFQYSVY